MEGFRSNNLFLQALILLGIIAFGFFLGIQFGVVQLAIEADRSYLSSIIIGLYLLFTCHWLWLVYTLTAECNQADNFETAIQNKTDIVAKGGSLVAALFINLHRQTNSNGERTASLVEAFGDQLINRHAFGHFASDALLRLGLLGTIIGFILMLLPVGQIQEFDSSVMQKLLASMSGGMAVALYTTLAGLISSTLLKLQYHLLDSAAVDVATRLSIAVQSLDELPGTVSDAP